MACLSVVLRGVFLFSLGVFFFWTCDSLQGVRGGFIDPASSIFDFINPNLWMPLFCGLASVAVGLLSPCMDFKIGAHDVYNKEWSSVFRCVALFFGLSHATARIDFASYAQLVIIIGGLSFGLWWIFDRTRVGLCCGMVAAIIATLLGHAFIRRRLLRLSHPTIAAWIPCLFFSGGVTVVLVGRQLAKPDVLARFKKKLFSIKLTGRVFNDTKIESTHCGIQQEQRIATTKRNGAMLKEVYT
ncbi:hypothetical protein CRM22_009928 [Opisthorchis felineus]|uniref:Insulin-induced gene 1 protein n=1 Tax=Opisthorchis felineus TaxID=147828 RepID=A0A4S2L4B9_OPIFE|nr:hypothetical protein CRM22_009928 [Opisthorchis felineus]